jgi:hypothetical protein
VEVGEVVDIGVDVAVEMVEPAGVGEQATVGVAQVPLADAGGLVAGGFQGFREQVFIDGEAVGRPGANDGVDHAIADGHAAGEEGGAGGGAEGEGVAAGEFDAFFGDAVYVERGGAAAVEADVAPAEVVGEEDDEVGGRGLGGERRGGGGEELTAGPHIDCLLPVWV